TYTDVRLYAVHRITGASVQAEPAHRPDGFSLDEYIAQGALQFGDGRTIRLKARISPWLADILTETPLTADQRLEPIGDELRLTATITDSWQLRWWILSQGAGMTVLEPKDLRKDIITELKNGLRGYGPD
ncbi:MAG: WYL domain-containing protein, partial [Bacteroidia bacterium]|nr:WYL domain-containing protein [Bacteroidia bacterium]